MSPDLTSLARHVVSSLLAEGHHRLSDFENALHQLVKTFCLEVMRQLFEALDEVVAQKAVEDGWQIKAKHGHRVLCRFGGFRYLRTMVQAVRNGAVHSPLAEHLGLLLNFVTPAAGRLAVRTLSGLSSRAAEGLLKVFDQTTPSRTTLLKLVREFGDEVNAHRSDVLGLLMERAGPPEEAGAVAVQLDGVMALMVDDRRAQLRERARLEGRKAGGPIGAEECSVGALVYYDAQGRRLSTVRVARMPEPGKIGLEADLRTLLASARAARPDLVVIALSDGASNHWSFLESLNPDHQVVDFYHAAEHIQRRLNRALGVGTHRNQAWFKRLRRMLLDGRHAAAFAALERLERRAGTFKPRKKRGRGAQPNFYERHRHRMDYARLRARNLPIGSGEIEGAARYIVVDRLRQTGMRWKRPGGQAILDLRCAVTNRIYDPLWAKLWPEKPVLKPLTGA